MRADGIFRTLEELVEHLDELPDDDDEKIVVFCDASHLRFSCKILDINEAGVELVFPNGMHICVELHNVGLKTPHGMIQHLEAATERDRMDYLAAASLLR